MPNRILFVDTDPNRLDGLRRLVSPLQHEWESRFATSGNDALALLAQAPSDVVVCDLRLQHLAGVSFLEELRRAHPQVIRMVLLGQASWNTNVLALGAAHQCLPTPCDAPTLKATIERALKLRDVLESDVLQRLVAQMTALPSLPANYLALMREAESPDASLARVGEIVARDLGLATKLLQAVNSAFFGLSRQVSDPSDAVFFLGLDVVKRLALTASVFAEFSPTAFKPMTEELWWHSLTVASHAKTIARLESVDPAFIEGATHAALLHDVGKLVMATCFHPPYGSLLKDAATRATPLWEIEHALLGVSHAEVGAYLLGLWGLPNPLVECVAWHHRVGDAAGEGVTPILVVHAADAIAHQLAGRPNAMAWLNQDYLSTAGLTERYSRWEDACRNVAAEANAPADFSSSRQSRGG